MAYNSIIVKCFTKIQEEYTATAVAIKPGYLLEMASATTVQAHSTAAGNALPMFAFEDELQGRGIDTDYAVSTRIQCLIPRRGDIIYAYLADGENASVGDFLESASAGALQVHVADEASAGAAIVDAAIIGQALEAVDLSNSNNLTALGRILVRII